METEVIKDSSEIEFTYDMADRLWSAKKKIGRQIAEINFTYYCNDLSETYYWWTSFIVYTKRKKTPQHFGNLEITGESGLEPIIFAKNALLEFEEILKKNHNLESRFHIICVAWTDKVRRKIYRHFLPRYGYKEGRALNTNVMMKRIK